MALVDSACAGPAKSNPARGERGLGGSFPAAKSNCASPGFGRTTVSGHFAQAGPVLGPPSGAGPVPAHFAPAGAVYGHVARAVSLPAHFGQPGRVGVFAGAGRVPGYFPKPVPAHFARSVPGHLEWAVRSRPAPAHLSRPPKPGIA